MYKVTTRSRRCSTSHRCPYLSGDWVFVKSDASRVSGILETSSYCNADICLPLAHLVHETTRGIYPNRLLNVGVTVTCSRNVEPESLGGRWSEDIADWVSSVLPHFSVLPFLTVYISQTGQVKRLLLSRVTQ